MRGVLIYLVASMALFGCGQDREARQQQSSKPEIQVIETAGRKTSDGLIAYTGASLWDGTGDPIIQGSTLIVEDGRIVGVDVDPPSGAEVVDVTGRWIIPGFINAHGHVSGRWASDNTKELTARLRADLALYARYGVTTVLSLGGAPEASFAIRQGHSSLVHAKLLLAGDVVVGTTPEEVAKIAGQNIKRGVDWLKLRVDDNLGTNLKMPWTAVQATFDIAKAAEIPVATHIFYMDDAARVLQMGSSLIAHSVRDQGVTDEFVQTILESGVCYVPTLVRELSAFVYSERPAWFDDPFFLEGAKVTEMERVTQPDFMEMVKTSRAAAGYRKALVQAKENLRVIVDAGVPVAFGTDSGPPGRFPGYFEHLEFGLMVEAGLTPREILLSATSVAAACLDLDDVGTLEAGNWADFIVLTKNPLDDIKATRSIERVLVGGKTVRR